MNVKFLLKFFIIFVSVLFISTDIKSQPEKFTGEIIYGDYIYNVKEGIEDEDGIIKTDIIIIDKNTGKTLGNLTDEINKNENNTGFQFVNEYRLIDLDKDGSDELLLNCFVGASPYFIFGITYLIDKKINYLPVYAIQGLTLNDIDSVNMIMRVSEKESPAVLGLWNEYYFIYKNGNLELVKSAEKLSPEMFNDQLYGDFITFSESENICETFKIYKSGNSEYNGYFWRAIENFFNNCYMTGDEKRVYDWFTTYCACADKQDIGIYFSQKSEKRFKDLSKTSREIYKVKY